MLDLYHDSSLAGIVKLMFVWDGKTTFGWFFHIWDIKKSNENNMLR